MHNLELFSEILTFFIFVFISSKSRFKRVSKLMTFIKLEPSLLVSSR
jgi:hypothetical protein